MKTPKPDYEIGNTELWDKYAVAELVDRIVELENENEALKQELDSAKDEIENLEYELREYGERS